MVSLFFKGVMASAAANRGPQQRPLLPLTGVEAEEGSNDTPRRGEQRYPSRDHSGGRDLLFIPKRHSERAPRFRARVEESCAFVAFAFGVSG